MFYRPSFMCDDSEMRASGEGNLIAGGPPWFSAEFQFRRTCCVEIKQAEMMRDQPRDFAVNTECYRFLESSCFPGRHGGRAVHRAR